MFMPKVKLQGNYNNMILYKQVMWGCDKLGFYHINWSYIQQEDKQYYFY